MVAVVATNPYNTTNLLGSFGVTATGLIQGTAMDSPSIRNELAGGILSINETIPMWGGLPISEGIPGAANAPSAVLGGIISRATNFTANTALSATGFSVFDQNYSMINSISSPVPMSPSYGQVNFYRFGSGARIVVKCSPNLINSAGQIITTKFSWDFVNGQLSPFVSVAASSGTYNTTTGLVTLTTASPHGLLPGDTFTITGVTGTGSFASANGTFVAAAGTTGSTLTYTIATGLTMTITAGTVGSAAFLPASVLDIQVGNSMVVNYNSTTNLATWDRAGSAAVILI